MRYSKTLGARSILFCLFLAATFLLPQFLLRRASPQLKRSSLVEFPKRISHWVGEDGGLPNEVLSKLGVDDYIMREYTNDNGSRFLLYIGYYEKQKAGKAIHSPKNCYPGSGWMKVESSVARFRVEGKDGKPIGIPVNRLLVEKGEAKELVYYWYQSMGKAEASEIGAGMVTGFLNSILYNRTDGALIRLSTRVQGGNVENGERMTEVIPAIYPLLGRYIPE